MDKIKTVTVRNMTLGDGMPKICIPVTAENREMMKKQVKQIQAGPCDMIEWRVDYYQETEEPDWLEGTLAYLRELIGNLPLLFTFRTKEEVFPWKIIKNGTKEPQPLDWQILLI